MPGPHLDPRSPAVTTADAGSAFGALHERFFLMPNPWDAGTARLLAQAGFKAVATSSGALAWSAACRDGGVDRDRAIAHAGLLGREAGLPVNADLETGYGATPATVAQTVELAIAEGIAGGSVEDLQRGGPEPLFDETLACRRIEAAREAIERCGRGFVLTGRCEAFLTGDPDPLGTVLRRLRAYVNAGAHVVYAPGLTCEADIGRVVDEVGAPVNVLAGCGGASNDLARLEALGVRRVSLGSNLYRVAMGAFMSAVEALRAGRLALPGRVAVDELDAAFARKDA